MDTRIENYAAQRGNADPPTIDLHHGAGRFRGDLE
jgi:hypothetical protein